ncbi:TPR-like protein [Clavulina sp. PMI_390]|nr:TPR-like protein [Clavulina sp. PMI_390]
MRLPSYLLSLILVAATAANADSGVESQSLATLTGQANHLLGLGQFGDAARRYSEAIEQSPSDYVLYYKRATAYYSMNRFSNALEDFETVLRLTDGSFSRALLMKANILAREGDWAEAKKLTKQYTKKSGTTDKDVQDLLFSITEGEVATKKAQQAAKANKYDECIEQSTNALTTASHATWLRELRVECAIANGDLEQAIGDLTRLTHLTKPTADRFLRIANMSYFLLPAPNPQPIQTVKQCLHFDPDSKPCRVAHRSLKAIEKDFVKLEDFERTSAWASLIRFVVGPGGIESDEGFAARFDTLLTSSTIPLNLPESVNPRHRSPRRLQIYGTACKAYVKSNQVLKAEKWCEETLRIDDKNLDGLIARGEKKLKDEEWEDAVRAFEAAFEASGRSNQEVRASLHIAQLLQTAIHSPHHLI